MHATALTDMERAGNVVTIPNPSREDIAKLLLHYGALKFQGHGIASNEDHHGDGSITISFVHYRTCAKCKEISKAKIIGL